MHRVMCKLLHKLPGGLYFAKCQALGWEKIKGCSCQSKGDPHYTAGSKSVDLHHPVWDACFHWSTLQSGGPSSVRVLTDPRGLSPGVIADRAEN